MATTPSPARPLDALVSVPLDAALQRRLDRLAARTGRSAAAVIAEAVAEYVERHDRAVVPSWVGAAGRQADTVGRARRSR
jgi:predicted transcriptional regulator